jgi:formamidopyrimidine-DNA glycosylase
MPELPEVENVARGLSYLEGRSLRRLEIFDKKVWFESSLPAEEFTDRRLQEVSRRGKYLIYRFPGLSLVQHLRMTGKMLEQDSAALPDRLRAQIGTTGPQALQLRCRFDFGAKQVIFYDTRRFGTLTAVPDEKSFFQAKGVAPDPLLQEPEAREHFIRRMRSSARPAKAALLDQSVVAGVGNIYADEALHRMGIHPARFADGIRNLDGLWQTIQELLLQSIEAGGTSVVDYLGADGQPGRFGERLLVYGREGEPCASCGQDLQRIQLAGRSTHFCRRCQRRR